MNPSQLQNHFDAFYEDFFCEMCKYGEVEEVVVCDNNNDRMYLCFPISAYAERLLGLIYRYMKLTGCATHYRSDR